MRHPLATAFRFAWQDLRGGLSGFGVFLVCIALGVAAVASVLGTSAALQRSLAEQGRGLLGGDAEFTLIHRKASADELKLLKSFGTVSEIASMRAMARHEGDAAAVPALVEIKAADAAYPLIGAVKTRSGISMGEAFAGSGKSWGVLVEQALLDRLHAKTGSVLVIGDGRYEVKGIISSEPDRIGTGFPVGPRVMMSREALMASGLVQPGSLIRWHMRVRLPGEPSEAQVAGLVAAAKKAAPDAGWRIRDRANAAPRLRRFVGRITLFFTFIALAALVTGGVGVAGSVRAYLDGRRSTIAILKCLGLSGRRIYLIYLLQILLLTILGVAAGLVLGAVVPYALAGGLNDISPLPLQVGLSAGPLAYAALSGLLIALIFALWPLGRARDIPASALFRDVIAPSRQHARLRDGLGIALLVALLSGLIIFGVADQRLAVLFVIGSLLCFAALALLARGLIALARRAPSGLRPELRLGIGSLYRPGAHTPGAILALGMGLTLTAALAQIDLNLTTQLSARIPDRAPAFFFAGLRPAQLEDFVSKVSAGAGVEEVETVPMLRGRIIKLKGIEVEKVPKPSEARWVLSGDRGITYSDTVPRGSSLTQGTWWAKGYTGPPLVSFSAREANALGLKPGDTITVNVMGRDITATIASLRKVDWTSLGINFVMVFSPNTLRGAPHSHLATAAVDPAGEDALLRQVAAGWPNVTALRVREALGRVNTLLAQFMVAVRLASLVTIIAGALVLAGAIAAGLQARIYEAAILKAAGVTRGQLMRSYLIEFLLLGLTAGGFALIAGSLIAWGVMTQLMHAEFIFFPLAAGSVAVMATAITIALGLVGIWRALGRKPASLLRAG